MYNHYQINFVRGCDYRAILDLYSANGGRLVFFDGSNAGHCANIGSLTISITPRGFVEIEGRGNTQTAEEIADLLTDGIVPEEGWNSTPHYERPFHYGRIGGSEPHLLKRAVRFPEWGKHMAKAFVA